MNTQKEIMKWVLQDIQSISKCQLCCKTIMKYVYSDRRGDLICCSSICVDNYMYGTTD